VAEHGVSNERKVLDKIILHARRRWKHSALTLHQSWSYQLEHGMVLPIAHWLYFSAEWFPLNLVVAGNRDWYREIWSDIVSFSNRSGNDRW